MTAAGRTFPLGQTDPDYDYIRNLVMQRSAIVLDASKDYLAESRLMPLAEREGMSSLGELVARLRGERFGRLHRKVVEAMTTNETSFFRDVHPFEALRKAILPDLLARRRSERRLSVWSAACASGQEAYSIAMLLRESFPELAGWRVEIIASDLSTEVLARARRGLFSQIEVNRGLPAALLVKHFRKRGTDWQLAGGIRSMVDFRELNLAETWPSLPRMDIVLLRNVLIYFDVETKRRVLARTREVMRPDGYLLLGAAETTFNLDDAFERIQLDRSGCYRLRAQ
jgi:chemotaxis protein methyltransferase CheR